MADHIVDDMLRHKYEKEINSILFQIRTHCFLKNTGLSCQSVQLTKYAVDYFDNIRIHEMLIDWFNHTINKEIEDKNYNFTVKLYADYILFINK
jgi:hypothetical protein